MLWFECDNETGLIVTGGIAATEAEARLRPTPEDQTLFVVPDGTVGNPLSPTPDFTPLKTVLCTKIDYEVGQIRQRYITDVPGQAQTYMRKEMEARAWTEGDEITNPDAYPFMIYEAQVREMTVPDLRAEIMMNVNLLTQLAVVLEGNRVATKKRIEAAVVLPLILATSVVDWDTLLTPPEEE